MRSLDLDALGGDYLLTKVFGGRLAKWNEEGFQDRGPARKLKRAINDLAHIETKISARGYPLNP